MQQDQNDKEDIIMIFCYSYNAMRSSWVVTQSDGDSINIKTLLHNIKLLPINHRRHEAEYFSD